MIHEVQITSFDRTVLNDWGDQIACEYAAQFPPIQLDAGQRYWIEIIADMPWSRGQWFWTASLQHRECKKLHIWEPHGCPTWCTHWRHDALAFVLFDTSDGVPLAPEDLQVEHGQSNAPLLSWWANDLDGLLPPDGFVIDRKDGATGTWGILQQIDGSVREWSDPATSYGVRYYYRLRAFNDAGFSEASNIAEILVNPLIAAPSDLSLVAAAPTTLQLSWNDNSTNELGFFIERRRIGSSTWIRPVESLNASTTEFNDSGLRPDQGYEYRVKAYNGEATSLWSEVLLVSTEPGDLPFDAEINVSLDGDGAEAAEVYVNGELWDEVTNGGGNVTVTGLEIGDWIYARYRLTEGGGLCFGAPEGWDRRWEMWVDSRTPDDSAELVATQITAPASTISLDLGHFYVAYNVIATVEWNACDDYLVRLSNSFSNLSRALWDITDGHALLNDVYIADCGNQGHVADYYIRRETTDQMAPHTRPDNVLNCYLPPLPRNLSQIEFPSMVRHGGGAPIPPGLDPASGIDPYANMMAHEFGHYAFGFWDEYVNGRGQQSEWTIYRRNHPNEVPLHGYGLMDLDESNLTEMSSASDYPQSISFNPNQTTQQAFLRRGSCWKRFVSVVNAMHPAVEVQEFDAGWLPGNVTPKRTGPLLGGSPIGTTTIEDSNDGDCWSPISVVVRSEESLAGRRVVVRDLDHGLRSARVDRNGAYVAVLPEGVVPDGPHDGAIYTSKQTAPRRTLLLLQDSSLPVIRMNPFGSPDQYGMTIEVTLVEDGASLVGGEIGYAAEIVELQFAEASPGVYTANFEVASDDTIYPGRGTLLLETQAIGGTHHHGAEFVLQPTGGFGFWIVEIDGVRISGLGDGSDDDVICIGRVDGRTVGGYTNGELARGYVTFGSLADQQVVNAAFQLPDSTVFTYELDELREIHWSGSDQSWIVGDLLAPEGSDYVDMDLESGAAVAITAPRRNEDIIAPASVIDIVARPIDRDGFVELVWAETGDDGTDGQAFRYDLAYGDGPFHEGQWDQLAKIEIMGESSTKDESGYRVAEVQLPEIGHWYHLAMKARDEVGNASPMSDLISCRTGSALDLLAVQPPTFVNADDHPDDDGSRIQIDWQTSADDGSGKNTVTGYRIYRHDKDLDERSLVGEVAAGVTSFVDSTVTDWREYTYAVAAVDSANEAVSIGDYSFSMNNDTELLADFSSDGRVDVEDVARFLDHFGASAGEARYESVFDLNGNGVIDDTIYLLMYYGTTGLHTGGPRGVNTDVGIDVVRTQQQIYQSEYDVRLTNLEELKSYEMQLDFSGIGSTVIVADVEMFPMTPEEPFTPHLATYSASGSTVLAMDIRAEGDERYAASGDELVCRVTVLCFDSYPAWQNVVVEALTCVDLSNHYNHEDDAVHVEDDFTPGASRVHAPTPNPFNGTVTIAYEIARREHVEIEIFDVRGRKVATIEDQVRPAGLYRTTWSGRDGQDRGVSSGVYFIRTRLGETEMTSKVTYVK
jgi:hypothetical protein